MHQIPGELCNFTASDGILLTGFLYNPTHSKKGIIYLHGLGSSMVGGPIWSLYAIAKKARIALLTFNNRGMGLVNGFKKVNGKRLLAGASCERFVDCIKDVDGAIQYMKKQGFRKVVLLGHGTGCQKTAYYLLKKKNKLVKGLILLAPVDDLNCDKKLYKKRYAILVKLCKNRVKKGKGNFPLLDPRFKPSKWYSPNRLLSVISESGVEANLFNYAKPLKVIRKIHLPILAIFGKKEEYAAIPPKDMLRMIKKEFKNKNSNTKLTPGTNNFKGGEKELVKVMVDWLKKVYHLA
ncbi:MAG TPA: DUF1749 domain-containing protein [Candidatus Nanoarchaeia archaeon]|nr:DUF1749 domain-containing protein [Candidatus Nanoarchaeia archaeon]